MSDDNTLTKYLKMITDIPTQADFEEAGLTFLNLAWDSVLSIYLKLDSMDDDSGYFEDQQVSDDYWAAAQTPLALAISLVQQGTEFLLKGRIVSVSPFLLIMNHPTNWPRNSESNNVSFVDFRTIDAQDLVKVHDTVMSHRLPDEFTERFNRLRQLRNSIIHTIDRGRRVDAKQLTIEILEVFNALSDNGSWVSARKKHLSTDHTSILYSSEYAHSLIAQEIMKAIELLEPSLAKKFFNFNKRQRKYICPQCYWEMGDFPTITANLSQLTPNSPESTTLHCILCQENINVVRKDCCKGDCKGNVLDKDEEMCLTCGGDQT